MVYEVLFFAGALGFFLMAALGFVHGHSGSHGSHSVGTHGHAGLGSQGHAALGGHGHIQHTHFGGHGAHPAPGHGPATAHGRASAAPEAVAAPSAIVSMAKSVALMAFSPLDVFSLAMGAGLVGTLLLTVLGPTQLLIAAICGALLFNFGVTKPLMRFFFAFAAPPSQGLEGMVSQPAEAETAFDHEGQGLIKLTLDGQTVQLLGKLDAGEQAAGVHVAKGDSVIILEVDAKKNICRVTRDLTL